MTDARYNTWLFNLHNKVNGAIKAALVRKKPINPFYNNDIILLFMNTQPERTCTPCDCFWTKTRHYNRHPDMIKIKNILCWNTGNNTGNVFRCQDKS